MVRRTTLYVPLVLCHAFILYHTVSGQGLPNQANYTGDLVLASFFPIHQRLPNSYDSVCGPIQHEDGIQLLEMLFFTLDKINEEKFLPGFKLGSLALDSCDDEAYALDQAVSFIKLLITKSVASSQTPYVCDDGTVPKLRPEAASWHKMVGLLGGASSAVTIPLAALLRLFSIPQVSYMATSPDLSNKDRFTFFKRTVPSDTNQAKAILEILKTFNWTYVSTVYEDSNYGLKGFAEFEKLATKEGICFAAKEIIEFDEYWWGEDDYDDIIKKLKSKHRAKAIVLFATHPHVREVFLAAKRMNLTNVVWIGSDAWSGRLASLSGVETIANNSITVQPMAFYLEEFDKYFLSLKPRNNRRNPWFREFWEQHFNCTLFDHGPHSGSIFPYGNKEKHTNVEQPSTVRRICTGDEKLSRNNGYAQHPMLHYIRDATYAFAHALKKMHAKVCKGQFGLCSEMHPANLSGSKLLYFLATVNFTSASGKLFHFINEVDGPPRYTVMNFRQVSHYSSGYEWTPIGSYSGIPGEGGLTFNGGFKRRMKNYPASFCSEKCSFGQVRNFLPTDRCCWICTNCTEFQYISSIDADETCLDCHLGEIPNALRNDCVAIPLYSITHGSPWGVTAMVVSLMGCIITTGVIIVYLVFNGTPVIKASGRELSLLLLGGIYLSYVVSFLFVARPSPIICGMTRFFLGFCYTYIYGAILTKTNRISRIFSDGSTSPKRARYTSPRSQMIIVCFIMFPELVILIAWLVADPPKSIHVFPTRAENVLVCSSTENWSFLIALAYPFLLILSCAAYAFKTRKTPSGFNETRLIGFTSYTTLVIWLAFVPIFFFTTDYNLKILTLCISLSLNATVVLGCLFAPKVYICLLRPEKNTRDAVMARSGSIISTGSQFPPPTPIKPSPPTERATIDLKSSTLPTKGHISGDVSLDPNGSLERDVVRSHSAPATPCSDQLANKNGGINLGEVYFKLRHPHSKKHGKDSSSRTKTESMTLVELNKDHLSKSSHVSSAEA